MKQNLTVSIEKELIRKLKVVAAKRSTSISKMLSDELAALVERSEQYDRCKAHALSAMESGFHLGGIPLERDELHER